MVNAVGEKYSVCVIDNYYYSVLGTRYYRTPRNLSGSAAGPSRYESGRPSRNNIHISLFIFLSVTLSLSLSPSLSLSRIRLKKLPGRVNRIVIVIDVVVVVVDRHERSHG